MLLAGCLFPPLSNYCYPDLFSSIFKTSNFHSFSPVFIHSIMIEYACHDVIPCIQSKSRGAEASNYFFFIYVHLDISRSISRWKGPISVALFVPDVEFSIAETFIEYLRNCYPAVKEQVDNECFHKYCHRQTGPSL